MGAANDQKRQMKAVLQQLQLQREEKRFLEYNQTRQVKTNVVSRQFRLKSPNPATYFFPTRLEFWGYRNCGFSHWAEYYVIRLGGNRFFFFWGPF